MKMELSVSERNLDLLKGMASNLSADHLAAMAEHIMSLMAKAKKPVDATGCHGLVRETKPGLPDCPHCSAEASLGFVTKKGMKANGAQRYQCKHCGKTFVSTTGTAFAHTRKDATTWRKYIQLTLSGASLHACKDECGISYQCSFDWRHKILNVFAENQKNTKMTGTVEVDEMFIPLSYKGNHVQGGFGARKKAKDAINNMPRKGYKRGTDNISRSSKEKACVFCMVEDGDKSFYAAVPGVGFMDETMLTHTVDKHIQKETAMMLADSYKITHQFLDNNGYQHTILSSNTSDNPKGHKPEIKDGLHLQHVNSMHQHIRRFLRPYCGVSSKYLSNYLALFVWLKNIQATKLRKTVDKVSVARAATPDCYITSSQLRSQPAVPVCA